MATPIIPSPKIRSKQKLDQYIRDTYAGYGPLLKTNIRLDEDTEHLHNLSTINITVKEHQDKKGVYYKTYTQKKPERFFAMSHPVLIQRKQKNGEQQ